MNISGTGNSNSIKLPTSQNPFSGKDEFTRSIESEIDAKRKELEALAEKQNMTPEQKTKKRQELQQEINELMQELRQHEIEVRRERAEKTESMEDLLGGGRKYSREKDNTYGFSEKSAEALISAEGRLKSVNAENAVKTRLEGHAGVLKGEIFMDKARGISDEKKEKELSEIEERMAKLSENQGQLLSYIDKDIKEASDSEKDTEDTVKADDPKEKTINSSREAWEIFPTELPERFLNGGMETH